MKAKIKTEASGFTLVELLVVIVVTFVLVVVVLPSFAMSHDGGQEARCLGNLRQLTAAWNAYTSDNRGKLVSNGDETHQPTTLTDPSALPGEALAQWCPGRQDNTSQLSPVTSTNNIGFKWIQLGLMYPYVGNVSAYHCPADTSSISAFGAKNLLVRSVSMNIWLSPLAPYNGMTSVES
jgi:type II secretory pathway pseudopilin PulG